MIVFTLLEIGHDYLRYIIYWLNFSIYDVIFWIQVTIRVDDTTVLPGGSSILRVSGPPRANVGFLAVDKAVYLLSDTGLLTKQSVRSWYCILEQDFVLFQKWFQMTRFMKQRTYCHVRC